MDRYLRKILLAFFAHHFGRKMVAKNTMPSSLSLSPKVNVHYSTAIIGLSRVEAQMFDQYKKWKSSLYFLSFFLSNP